jgi:hypothetical protein
VPPYRHNACCQCYAHVSVTHSGRRVVTVGLEPSDRRRSCADPPHRRLRAHCTPRLTGSRPSLPTRAAPRVDCTPLARAQCAVMRRAALETGGLTMVSAYLPSVSVGKPCRVLGTRSPPTRIKCSSWAGVPRRAFCHGHVAGPALRSPP